MFERTNMALEYNSEKSKEQNKIFLVFSHSNVYLFDTLIN